MSASGAPPPLGPHLRALVAEEQHMTAVDPQRMRAVLTAVESVVAASAPATAAAATAATGTAAGKIVAIAVTTFVLGAGVGASVDHALTKRGPRADVSPVTSIGSSAVALPPPTALPEPTSEASTASAQPTPPPVPASASPASASASARAVAAAAVGARPASEIAQEEAIIDAARGGLATNRPDVVLEAVSRHERAFPNGQLAEERDALRILALARSGRTSEARTRMAAFRRAHPTSPLLEKLGQELAKP